MCEPQQPSGLYSVLDGIAMDLAQVKGWKTKQFLLMNFLMQCLVHWDSALSYSDSILSWELLDV